MNNNLKNSGISETLLNYYLQLGNNTISYNELVHRDFVSPINRDFILQYAERITVIVLPPVGGLDCYSPPRRTSLV